MRPRGSEDMVAFRTAKSSARLRSASASEVAFAKVTYRHLEGHGMPPSFDEGTSISITGFQDYVSSPQAPTSRRLREELKSCCCSSLSGMPPPEARPGRPEFRLPRLDDSSTLSSRMSSPRPVSHRLLAFQVQSVHRSATRRNLPPSHFGPYRPRAGGSDERHGDRLRPRDRSPSVGDRLRIHGTPRRLLAPPLSSIKKCTRCWRAFFLGSEDRRAGCRRACRAASLRRRLECEAMPPPL